MLPDFTVDGPTLTQIVAYGLVGALAWLAQKNLSRIELDVTSKADKESTEKEIEGLKMGLKEARETRERDVERMERASSEKFAEFSTAMRDRITSMERNVNDRIVSMRDDMGHKLDMILQVVDRGRKE